MFWLQFEVDFGGLGFGLNQEFGLGLVNLGNLNL